MSERVNTLRYHERTIPLDEDGFLVNQEDWNEEIAALLAQEEGIPSLNTDQLEIIRSLREYFKKNKVFPILNAICHDAGQSKQCVPKRFINPEKAWKIAGLPKQDSIYFFTFDGKKYSMEAYC